MSRPVEAVAEPLPLDEPTYQLLASRLGAVLASLGDQGARAAYEKLARALEDRSVPPELQHHLANLIEFALEGGRIRKKAGPEAELRLIDLFNRTTRGVALTSRLDNINHALTKMVQDGIEKIGLQMRAPSIYVMTITSKSLRLVVRFDWDGPEVETLEVG